MGGKNVETEDAKWPDKNEVAFLQILLERVKNDPNGTPRFNKSSWDTMDSELFSLVGERYGVDRLKGKYNRLRIKYRQFCELLEHKGITYDSERNIVFAADDVWQVFYQKHKNFKAFKKHGCLNYELLGQVFNKSAATGHLHHPSTQLPHNLDEVHDNDDEFLSKSVHEIEGEKSGVGSFKGKCPSEEYDLGCHCNCVKKESTLAKVDSRLEMMVSSLNAKIERAELLKRQSTKAFSQLSDPYSIEECMDVLEIMDDVSDASYNKALEKFLSSDWRKMFIKMSTARRKSWLRSLE